MSSTAKVERFGLAVSSSKSGRSETTPKRAGLYHSGFPSALHRTGWQPQNFNGEATLSNSACIVETETKRGDRRLSKRGPKECVQPKRCFSSVFLALRPTAHDSNEGVLPPLSGPLFSKRYVFFSDQSSCLAVVEAQTVIDRYAVSMDETTRA